jgi:hypothetical protein
MYRGHLARECMGRPVLSEVEWDAYATKSNTKHEVIYSD